MRANILITLSLFALIDANGVVKQVIVAGAKALESMPAAQFKLKGVACGAGCAWVETSQDGSIGKNYARIGGSYDGVKKGFMDPKPFPSWTYDENLKLKAPKSRPADGKDYEWDEAVGDWKASKEKQK